MKLKYPELQLIIIKKVSELINEPEKFRIVADQYKQLFGNDADLWQDYTDSIKNNYLPDKYS